MTFFERHDAIVTDPNDPEKFGRLKVKCSTLIDEDQELPFWVPPRFHFVSPPNGGYFGIPAKDSWVELLVPVESKFDEVPEEQSLQMEGGGLRWTCTAYNDVQALHEYFKTNYPERRGYVWPNGWVWYTDSKSGEMTWCYAPDEKKDPEAWIKILKDHTIELGNSDGMKVLLTDSKIIIEATGGPVEIVADNIKLGGVAATEHLVLGDVLKTWLTTEQAAFGSLHTHVCAAPGSPSGPPVPTLGPVPANLLSTKHTVE